MKTYQIRSFERCRHVSRDEIDEVLASGRINDRKSDTSLRPCPKYVVDGRPGGRNVQVSSMLISAGRSLAAVSPQSTISIILRPSAICWPHTTCACVHIAVCGECLSPSDDLGDGDRPRQGLECHLLLPMRAGNSRSQMPSRPDRVACRFAPALLSALQAIDIYMHLR